eukprot:CAMPEP_0181242318 /NCGR_PEP_ID=MMETSP1096-20121128/41615_1 /TAXON_ID=156174 ORGANISM="Chrysochromulina ericina, Strain CCMP281" /NCGR_SAMPLE_ID=MMETSP1096 /ASSEMBLY_ACC=CAM_ASM_000453 /LENGTH=75 /DNA_ID=CAMNT_0023338497 /DNA_START=269 /DNA_END=496 /DNA_ORIENTATION=+
MRPLKGHHADFALVDLAKGDRDTVSADRRDAVLRHVGAVAVEHENRSNRQRHREWCLESALTHDVDVGAKQNRLF